MVLPLGLVSLACILEKYLWSQHVIYRTKGKMFLVYQVSNWMHSEDDA